MKEIAQLTSQKCRVHILCHNHKHLDYKLSDNHSQTTICIQKSSGSFFQFLHIHRDTRNCFCEPSCCKHIRHEHHKCLLEHNSLQSQYNRFRFRHSQHRKRTGNGASRCQTRNWRMDGSCWRRRMRLEFSKKIISSMKLFFKSYVNLLGCWSGSSVVSSNRQTDLKAYSIIW